MTLDQALQVAQSPVTAIIMCAIIAVVIKPWLNAHKAQVDATTAKIQNEDLRNLAQKWVRSLEQDPAEAQLPGLIQRQHGISGLAKEAGIDLGTAGPAIDDAYNLLTSTGQLTIAPKPVTPTPVPTDTTLGDQLKDMVTSLEQFKVLLAGSVLPPQQPPADPLPPAPTPVPLTPQPSPSTGSATVVPISGTASIPATGTPTLAGVNQP